MAERLILVRHGESAGAGGGRLHGHDDRPLSSRGRAQAGALAVELTGVLDSAESVSCVVSPLQRTRQTAEHALAGSGLVAEPLPELIEVDVGDWEGLTFAEAAARSPEEADRWASWDPDFAFPGGESLAAFLKRVGRVCDDLRERPQQTVIAFTHGGVIRTALCRLLGLDARSYLIFDVGPACVVTVRMYGELGVLSGMRNTSL